MRLLDGMVSKIQRTTRPQIRHIVAGIYVAGCEGFMGLHDGDWDERDRDKGQRDAFGYRAVIWGDLGLDGELFEE